MSPILEKESYPGWRYYGKRYIHSNDFMMLCTAVGLYHSHEWELEDCERVGIMLPVARMIMPDEYARAMWMLFNAGVEKVDIAESLEAYHQLDWAIRYPITPRQGAKISDVDLHHPIDTRWGDVEGLIVPTEQEFFPWEQYQIPVEYEGRTYKQ